MMKLFRNASRGLGLVEVMVGLAVLGVLAAAAIPSMLDLLERRRVVAVGLEIANILNFAKSETNVNGQNVTVHLEKDPKGELSCASVNVLHAADTCVCYLSATKMCGKSKIVPLRVFQVQNVNGVTFDATASSWGEFPERLTFARNLHFSEAADVQVNVKGARTGAQFRVELNLANRVRICSPDGSINGFPTC